MAMPRKAIGMLQNIRSRVVTAGPEERASVAFMARVSFRRGCEGGVRVFGGTLPAGCQRETARGERGGRRRITSRRSATPRASLKIETIASPADRPETWTRAPWERAHSS